MKIIGALLARNEGGSDRYLERSVQAALDLCDRVVVLDDGSTDETASIAAQVDSERVTVHERGDSEGWWGREESNARAQLWELAAEEAGPDGWILVLDADMILEGVSREDLRKLCSTSFWNAWACPLWDCWDSEGLMRVDGYWKAQENPRVWLFKAQPEPGFQPEWRDAVIHAGHAPANYPVMAAVMPGVTAWRHLAYVKDRHRLTKYRKYVDLAQPNNESEDAERT